MGMREIEDGVSGLKCKRGHPLKIYPNVPESIQSSIKCRDQKASREITRRYYEKMLQVLLLNAEALH